MRRFAKMLLVTLGFGVLGFVLSLVPQKAASGTTAAEEHVVKVHVVNTPLPVSDVNAGNFTHDGQKASGLVSLVSLHDGFFVQMRSDGSFVLPACGEARPFCVAFGVFVLTDLEWTCTGGTAGHTATLELGDLVQPDPLFLVSSATVNADGAATANVSLQGGVGIGGGTGLSIIPVLRVISGCSAIGPATAHGYMVPNL